MMHRCSLRHNLPHNGWLEFSPLKRRRRSFGSIIVQRGPILGSAHKGRIDAATVVRGIHSHNINNKNGHSQPQIVDLRSDTVTLPSPAMLGTVGSAALGDDVMGEDPTVIALQDYMADLFGKDRGLFVPTGTMSNLVALLAHCHHTRATEIIVGSRSHIHLWEGGNASNLGGIYTTQVAEDDHGMMDVGTVLDCRRTDQDDHWPETALLCLENTHNMAGGVALPKSYMDRMGTLAHDVMDVRVHVDGARIFNASIALRVSVADLCEHADSVSICLSKGLGAPLGSVLVGENEFIRLAKRARKRCGGGMRQAGVVAAMGLYAVQNHVDRLEEDHIRAADLARALVEAGFGLPRGGQVDTNIVYFALPEACRLTREEFQQRLAVEYGVKVTGGYSHGGRLFRAVTHMQINDEGIDRAIEGIVTLGTWTGFISQMLGDRHGNIRHIPPKTNMTKVLPHKPFPDTSNSE